MKLLALAALVFVTAAWSQEVKHAPSIAQCRADQRLWFSKITDSDSLRATSILQLEGWTTVMNDCKEVDADNVRPYLDVITLIKGEEAVRLINFVSRHHLTDQFLAEDAAGKR